MIIGWLAALTMNSPNTTRSTPAKMTGRYPNRTLREHDSGLAPVRKATGMEAIQPEKIFINDDNEIQHEQCLKSSFPFKNISFKNP